MRIALFWVLGLACFSLKAQPLEKSLLWKISGNGLKEASYLYGTIHLTCDATLDRGVRPAMDKTTQLYLELDMDDTALQADMVAVMMMKDDAKMTDLATPEDIKAVDAFLQTEIGMPLVALNTVKPLFVSMLLVPKLLDCQPKSVEESLMAISREQNEQILGLETVQDQMAALDAIPYKEQMAELVKAAKSDLKNDRIETTRLTSLYAQKDIEGMLAAARESENVTTSKYENDLLVKRNLAWAPKIATISRQSPTFFAVGAAHLAGEEGVIKLLRKAGYRVEAVR